METFVIDTSVVVQWFNKTNELHSKKARQILKDLQNEKIHIVIPDSLPLELLNALLIGKKCPLAEANLAVKRLFDSPINIVEVSLSILEQTSLVMKHYNLTSYDAYFLALAEYENCRLISDDKKAHGKILDGNVLMLKDYR